MAGTLIFFAAKMFEAFEEATHIFAAKISMYLKKKTLATTVI